MPAPMTAPIANMIRSPAPSTRLRLVGPLPISATIAPIGLMRSQPIVS